jgi:hypothetical protein
MEAKERKAPSEKVWIKKQSDLLAPMMMDAEEGIVCVEGKVVEQGILSFALPENETMLGLDWVDLWLAPGIPERGIRLHRGRTFTLSRSELTPEISDQFLL